MSVDEVKISTHALTWSATNEQPAADVQEVISTHALTWSATLKELRQKRKLNMISTHALTWSATRPTNSPRTRCTISTHALTWSATAAATTAAENAENFNSRAHVERDPSWTSQAHLPTAFQLTRSRGARLPCPQPYTSSTDWFQLTRSRGAPLD